jgi:hypothetical protein
VNAVRTPTLCYEIILNLASTKISTWLVKIFKFESL